MATLYWYGWSGNYSDYTNHWSNNSWNSPASPSWASPTSSDDVVFDTNSSAWNYSVTIDSTASCLNMTWGNPSWWSPTLAWSTSALSIYWNAYFVSWMTISNPVITSFKATSWNKTITTNSCVFSWSLSFNWVGWSWQLQDDLTTSQSIDLTNGTLDLNNKNITAVAFGSNNANIRTLIMWSWTMTLSWSGTVWNTNNISNFTINEWWLVKFINNSSSAKTIFWGWFTFNNFQISTGWTGAVIIDWNNTFNDFKIDAGRQVNFTNSTTQTVTTFTATWSAWSIITLRNSSSTTTATLAKAWGGIISCDYMDVDYLVGSPADTWYMGENSTDWWHNTNIYFEAPPITTNIKSFNGLAYASVKSVNWLAIASVKSYNWLT